MDVLSAKCTHSLPGDSCEKSMVLLTQTLHFLLLLSLLLLLLHPVVCSIDFAFLWLAVLPLTGQAIELWAV